MGMVGNRPIAFLLFGAAFLLSSCVSMTRTTLIPEEQNEVYVPYFENKTFIRSLGLNLTEQVKAAILLRPGVSIVSKEDAEVYLTGRIVAKSQRVLSEDVNQVVTSERHTITVEVDILDAMTGDLIKRSRLTHSGEFVAALGEAGGDAETEAIDRLARDIVRLLEEDF